MASHAKAPLKNTLFQKRGVWRINHALKEGRSGVGQVKMDKNSKVREGRHQLEERTERDEIPMMERSLKQRKMNEIVRLNVRKAMKTIRSYDFMREVRALDPLKNIIILNIKEPNQKPYSRLKEIKDSYESSLEKIDVVE